MRQEWFRKDIKEWQGRPFDPKGDPSMRPRFYNSIDDAFQLARKTAFLRLEDTDAKFGQSLREGRIRAAKMKLGSYDDLTESTPSTEPVVNKTVEYELQRLMNY